MEEGSEFVERFTHREEYPWPMFTSCCPGWVRFVKSVQNLPVVADVYRHPGAGARQIPDVQPLDLVAHLDAAHTLELPTGPGGTADQPAPHPLPARLPVRLLYPQRQLLFAEAGHRELSSMAPWAVRPHSMH